jgi:Holliday junction resolvasome RuvABC endonuclease subunit
MDSGGILALDLSGIVGWCLGPVTTEKVVPLCGAWMLPRVGGLGALLASFENELIQAISFHQPAHVVMEAPLPAQGQASTMVAMQQFGLAAMAEASCWRNDVRLHQIAASTVRKAVMGTGRFKAGTAKAEVMRFCVAQGWPVPDHNSADACLTWKYAAMRLSAGGRIA